MGRVKWQWLWFATSSVLVATLGYGWVAYDGDISFGRLSKIPLPEQFEWYHAAAPLVLLILTRFGMPVSTTFLVLSVFSSSAIIDKMVKKSIIGYVVAAVFAYLLWRILQLVLNEKQKVGNTASDRKWRIIQWFATGFLWCSWLQHDMANIAVYLPRQLSVYNLIFILTTLIACLGLIFWTNGGKIQKVVLSKSGTRYVRSATIIDFALALTLWFFKEVNDIPMSTTWVFVGLLTGRELAVFRIWNDQKKMKAVFPILAVDFVKIVFGLLASVALVLLIPTN